MENVMSKKIILPKAGPFLPHFLCYVFLLTYKIYYYQADAHSEKLLPNGPVSQCFLYFSQPYWQITGGFLLALNLLVAIYLKQLFRNNLYVVWKRHIKNILKTVDLKTPDGNNFNTEWVKAFKNLFYGNICPWECRMRTVLNTSWTHNFVKPLVFQMFFDW